MVKYAHARDSVIAQKERVISNKAQRITILEEFVRLHKLKTFTASTEKSVGQQEMFNEAELSVAAEEVFIAQKSERDAASHGVSVNVKLKAGRKPLPDSLPRIRIEHRIPQAEQVCDCGCQRVEIGEVASEQLDVIPAKVQVIVNVRKKYACQHCESGVVTTPLPPQPIPKSNASPGMLAHVAIAKYQDGLPLHRQEAVLNRSYAYLRHVFKALPLAANVEEIAHLLDRSESTISRELFRNRGKRGYRSQQAQRKADERRAVNARTIDETAWAFVQEKLREEWSPEQISGHLEAVMEPGISYETIYQRVYTDKQAGGDLWRYLRCQKVRRKRYGTTGRRGSCFFHS